MVLNGQHFELSPAVVTISMTCEGGLEGGFETPAPAGVGAAPHPGGTLKKCAKSVHCPEVGTSAADHGTICCSSGRPATTTAPASPGQSLGAPMATRAAARDSAARAAEVS
eukprot:7123210-Pyramimonas_sp.AAC.1